MVSEHFIRLTLILTALLGRFIAGSTAGDDELPLMQICASDVQKLFHKCRKPIYLVVKPDSNVTQLILHPVVWWNMWKVSG